VARGAALRQRVLDDVLDKRKLMWAERFTRIASWLKETPSDPAWPFFVVLARAVADGYPLARISLMCEMAETTIVATRGARR
jgi:pyridoxine/pyridoxamine 5'-phosphate oxidase